jgi:hypothetical protein
VTDEAQVRQRAFELAAEGLPKEEVAQRLREELGVEIQPGTISAWKAHQTMGTYGAAAAVEEVEGARDLKFGLERDMQVALRENISQLDPACASSTAAPSGTWRPAGSTFSLRTERARWL